MSEHEFLIGVCRSELVACKASRSGHPVHLYQSEPAKQGLELSQARLLEGLQSELSSLAAAIAPRASLIGGFQPQLEPAEFEKEFQ
jgi:hypothetical protein